MKPESPVCTDKDKIENNLLIENKLLRDAVILTETRACFISRLRDIYTLAGQHKTNLRLSSVCARLFLDEITKANTALKKARLGIEEIDRQRIQHPSTTEQTSSTTNQLPATRHAI